MNYSSFAYLLIFLTSGTLIAACPTCVAKVQPNSPPFFVDEFYASYDEKYDIDLMLTGTES